MTKTRRQNEADVFRNKFTEKSFKILSILLLNDKPLTTTEIAKLSGYPRTTIEPYVLRLAFAGYIIDEGRDKLHGWAINRNHENEIFAKLSVVNNTTTTIFQKYDKNPKWHHLIDADSHGGFPNLAIMRMSTFFKKQGHRVTFSKGRELGFSGRAPDYIHVSIIFRANKEMFDYLHESYPDTVVDIGGSGYDLTKKLPTEIESCPPDYSLYPRNKSSIGFSSRGCIRSCSFCVVPEKEGFFCRTQHPCEWYNPQYKKITFLDNNILVDKKWFFEITSWCMEKDLKIWFTQGLDIRLLDLQVAKRLLGMKRFKMITFAWDRIEDEGTIRQKIALLKRSGFDDALLRAKVMFYVYVENDSDSEYDSAVYRCRELKKLGCNSYVMFNIDSEKSQRITHLKQWSNAKMHFWRCDIGEYRQSARTLL